MGFFSFFPSLSVVQHSSDPFKPLFLDPNRNEQQQQQPPQIVPLAQRVARGATARRFYSILLKCGALLKRAIDRASSGKDDVTVLDKAIAECARLVGPMRSMYGTEHPLMKEAKTLRFKLREWMELTEIYRKLKNKDPTANYGEFTDAVKRGTKIMDVPHTQEMEQLYLTCKELLDNCVSIRLDPLADEALYTLNEGALPVGRQQRKRERLWMFGFFFFITVRSAAHSFVPIVLPCISSFLFFSFLFFFLCFLRRRPLPPTMSYHRKIANMRDVLAQAQEAEYTSNDIKEIERVLALPEAELTKLQLKKAIELNDPQRRIHREVALQMMFLKQNAIGFKFERFTRLRDPVEFAAAKFMSFMRNKDAIAEGMLVHSSKPIHISLVEFADPATSKQAVKMFKNVLGYMGDRKYANPTQLGTDILNTCLAAGDDLRIELFCQIMKQLRGNPDAGSMHKGQELMALCLHTFPIPDQIESQLTVWLMENFPGKGQQWISELHRNKYGGPSNMAMDASQIKTWVAQFFPNKKRSRFSIADTGAMVNVSGRRTSNTAAAAAAVAGGESKKVRGVF